MKKFLARVAVIVIVGCMIGLIGVNVARAINKPTDQELVNYWMETYHGHWDGEYCEVFEVEEPDEWIHFTIYRPDGSVMIEDWTIDREWYLKEYYGN